MSSQSKPNALRGLVAGAAGGYVASWVMNLFLAGSSKAQNALKTPAEKEEAAKQEENAGDDSTQKVADAIVEQTTGKPLSEAQKETGGPIVHYVFGSLMGGVYGVLAEYVPSTTLTAPVVFGSALFLGADEVVVPALGLAEPPSKQPLPSQANHWAAHIVYSVTVDLVRRGLRRVL